MKSILFLFLAIAFQMQATAQNDSLKQRYLQKAKKQNTAGWLLVTGGVVLGIYTIAATPKAVATMMTSDQPTTPAAGITAPLAVVALVTSIPFFISATSNKKKARLMVSSSYIPQL